MFFLNLAFTWTTQRSKDLKSSIREEIANIIPAMVVSVMTDTIKGLTQCIENGVERYLPDLTVKIKLKNVQKVHNL